jgi:hypothetical protein
MMSLPFGMTKERKMTYALCSTCVDLDTAKFSEKRDLMELVPDVFY